MASSMCRPSTNCRPSSCSARTVAATTVLLPRRVSRPPSASPSGRNFFDSAIALLDRLARTRCGLPSGASPKSARPSWSAVSAIAVSASGTRSSASARRISARPSALVIGYSRSSDSIAQNGAGVRRTPSTHGVAAAATCDQFRPRSRVSDASTTAASSRYGCGRRALVMDTSGVGLIASVSGLMPNEVR
jgi:hypothetical protein